MDILSVIKDERIDANSVLVEMTIGNYVELIKKAEANLDIQRRAIHGFKPYERLREDLRRGCLIPPPVIAVKHGLLPEPSSRPAFVQALATVGRKYIYIIDGVQRTNAILQVIKALADDAPQRNRFLARPFRVEVWPDISVNSLTYRMILLNAGQKPMSLRHQIEVVSFPLRDYLKDRFGNRIILYLEKDTERRSQPGEYQFSLIAQAFQAYLQKAPHIDLRNEVMDELTKIDVLDAYRDLPVEKFAGYIDFLCRFDEALFRVYPDKRIAIDGAEIPAGKTLLTRDTFHLGLAAAYSWCESHKPEKILGACEALLNQLNIATPGIDDPLALARYDKIIAAFKRKDNVGEQRRNLTFRGFREFFSTEGAMPMETCWVQY